MQPVAVLRRGDFVCELVASAAHPWPSSSDLAPGARLTILTRRRVLALGGPLHTLEVPHHITTAVRVLRCGIGSSGWNVEIEVVQESSPAS